jgi:hypothetical protein
MVEALEIVGPFKDYRIVWNGYEVPYVTAIPCKDGRYHVMVDKRFGIHEPVTREELANWAPILAHAMAVAAGYSCHGENSAPINPFKVGMSRIHAPPSLTLVDPEGGSNG